MSGNLSVVKFTFLLDEQWVRGGGRAYKMAAERTEYVVYKNYIFVHTRTAGQKDMYFVRLSEAKQRVEAKYIFKVIQFNC